VRDLSGTSVSNGFAKQFFAGISEHPFGLSIHEDDASVLPDDDNCIRRSLENSSKEEFGASPRGYVAVDFQNGGRLP